MWNIQKEWESRVKGLETKFLVEVSKDTKEYMDRVNRQINIGVRGEQDTDGSIQSDKRSNYIESRRGSSYAGLESVGSVGGLSVREVNKIKKLMVEKEREERKTLQ